MIWLHSQTRHHIRSTLKRYCEELEMGRILLLTCLLLNLLVGAARGDFICQDFHFGACDVELGGVIDSFELPPSPTAAETCQRACQVSHLIRFFLNETDSNLLRKSDGSKFETGK